MRQLNTARGLTLIELMVGLTIAAFLLMAAAPFFGDYIRNSRLREAGNALLGEALFAQSEAIKRNTTVRLSTSGATLQVIDRSDRGRMRRCASARWPATSRPRSRRSTSAPKAARCPSAPAVRSIFR